MIRIGMISYWHVHAEDYTRQVLEHPETEIAAVWDELPERGREKAEKYGVPFFSDLGELLAKEDIDAVVVDAPTNVHRDVMVQAARAGKHIFTEKVIAPTLSEANEILEEVRKAGVKLTVSLPRLYDAYTPAIRKVVEDGTLGKLTLARARLSHNGATAGWLPEHFFSKEQCGGGALIDLGCHPMYLVRTLLGLPDSVSAVYGHVTGKEVEDNATAVLSYENGAIGIVEAGFVNSHSPFSIELHGTDGTLLFGFPEEKILVRSNKLGDDWQEIKPGDRLPWAFYQWVSHIQEGTEATENVEIATDLTKLMEASNRSVAEGRPIRLSELAKS
ncbi:Gfo/Idh/MocA family protein [Cohnella thailandensis]|uniref:Gfo/Idh/MocA family oxidoreductase n=1 Tax=Cohnella thailandensis TaxID=557557 RepID=A0A841SRD2_9BACL|nr:Gfo/Idh/MocA family oxidoreductase [Cohnella thailandensis]MBB6633469.1 Gfo/Idh/MocA family oxidoreductase [Cohnella thailandensis]MBP1974486.1 putative dehydrogenase [Cohnella thailandensis]